jgi:hypothetical protein
MVVETYDKMGKRNCDHLKIWKDSLNGLLIKILMLDDGTEKTNLDHLGIQKYGVSRKVLLFKKKNQI